MRNSTQTAVTNMTIKRMLKNKIIHMRFIVMLVTAVCVLFLIKLRWPKKKNFYDTVYMRYGQETLKIVRNYEKDLSRFNKASLDIGCM